MKALAAAKGGRCISDTYVNVKTKLKWECSKGHQWFATPDAIKYHSSWCHVCGGYNQKDTNPKIADTTLIKEWDFEKNHQNPQKITSGSNKKVWWKCPKCELSYDAVVHTRPRAACPYCALKRPSHFRNLELLFPKISKRFITEKNGIIPSEVSPTSKKSYWWRCENGHEYENSCANMTKQGDDARACRFCNGNDVWPGESAADLFPEILDQVDISKNSKEILFRLYSPS